MLELRAFGIANRGPETPTMKTNLMARARVEVGIADSRMKASPHISSGEREMLSLMKVERRTLPFGFNRA